jgi:hypothetical protein
MENKINTTTGINVFIFRFDENSWWTIKLHMKFGHEKLLKRCTELGARQISKSTAPNMGNAGILEITVKKIWKTVGHH